MGSNNTKGRCFPISALYSLEKRHVEFHHSTPNTLIKQGTNGVSQYLVSKVPAASSTYPAIDKNFKIKRNVKLATQFYDTQLISLQLPSESVVALLHIIDITKKLSKVSVNKEHIKFKFI